MKTKFEEYLIGQGYRLITPSGKPSTVYDYLKRIDKVCVWEGCTWKELSENIDSIVEMYDTGGEKSDLGNISHRAVINALKQFEKFVQLYRKCFEERCITSYLHAQRLTID